ncbi:MAG: PilN domain-containing protein [Leptospirillia bacterium]
MIHINLLPAKRGRVSKKALELRNFLIAAGGAISVVVLLGGVVSWGLGSKVSGLEKERSQVAVQLNLLKSKSARIAGYEEARESFESKIQVIRRLKHNQVMPVRLLDQLAQHLPDRVWLISLSENSGRLSLVGRAIANSDIVEMLQQMKQADIFGNIQLLESRRLVDNGNTSYEFTLTAQIKDSAKT